MAAHFQTPPTQAACASDDDGINVLGTPLGSSDFVESYLLGKGIKHRQLLSFITEVAAARFPREAVAMLTGVACWPPSFASFEIDRKEREHRVVHARNRHRSRLDLVTMPLLVTRLGTFLGSQRAGWTH